MKNWRAVGLFASLSLLAAACGGSGSQREGLESGAARSDTGATTAAAPEPGTDSAPVPAPAEPAAPEAAPAGPTTPAARATPALAPKAAAPKQPGPGSRSPSPSKAAAGAAPAPAAGAAGGGAPAAAGPAAPAPAPGAAPAPAPGAAGGQPTATDVGVTADTIKVGHIGIYSGPVGYVGQHLSLAARATLQSINDAGGVNGRKLDVHVRDDGWDGTKGLNAARDLVEREKIFAFCCIQSVSTTDVLTPYSEQTKVPHLGGDGWGQVQYTGQWTFPMGAPSASEGRVLAKYQVEKQGVKKAAILHLNNATGQSFRDAYKEVLEKMGGKVELVQPATFDDPGTTTLLARARAANVDTIAIYADSGIVARLVREAAGQGYKPPKGFAGSAMFYFKITHELSGPAGEGLISASHWTPHDQDTPGLRRYREVVTKYYPDIDHTSWTVTSFMGANLFGETLKKLGVNVTRQGFKDAVDQVTDFDLGLGTKITFRPGRRYANTQIHLVQLQKQGDGLTWKSLNHTERDATYDK